MSSVAIQKLTYQAFSVGQVKHCFRQNESYSNNEIKLEESYKNEFFGDVGPTSIRQKLKRRIKEVDSEMPPKRLRKDRVVCCGLVITAPREGMSDKEESQFLSLAYEELTSFFGKKNVIGGVAHYDEKHEYHDHGEIHKSRGHLHAFVVPYVAEKGINGKQFLTKETYRQVNELMDKLCQKLYGFGYQDGTKAPSRGKVEELKKAEEIIKQKEKKISKLEEKLQALELLLEKFKNKLKYAKAFEEAMAEAEAEIEAERERGRGKGRGR